MRSELLSSILTAISKRVNHQSFDMWFKPISSARKDDSTIYLGVPTEVFRDWITNNYFDVIEESLHELNLDAYQLKFSIDEGQPSEAASNTPSSDAYYAARAVAFDGPGLGAGVVRA